jgi:hypothetical protein
MTKTKCSFPGCRRTTKSLVEWEHGLVRVRARTKANWPGLEDGWYCPLHFAQLEMLAAEFTRGIKRVPRI